MINDIQEPSVHSMTTYVSFVSDEHFSARHQYRSVLRFILLVPVVLFASCTDHAKKPATATAAGQINAAIPSIASSGGRVSAIVLSDAQDWVSDPFSSVTKPIVLALGAGTTTVSTNVTVPSNVTLRFNQGTILSVNSGKTLTINGSIDAPLTQIFAGSGTVTFTGTTHIDRVYPQWWGAIGDGVSNDQPAIQAALNAAESRGGGTLRLPVVATRYLVKSEILVNTDNVYFECESQNVVIRAGSANQKILHWSAAHGGASNCTLDGNNLFGTTGLRVSPQDETQRTTVVTTSFNHFHDLRIINTDEGVVVRTGPQIMGTASDASYNAFFNIKIQDSLRGILLTNHPSAAATWPSPDTNQWYSILCYSRATRSNTCIQIDAGSQNTFYGSSSIGMSNGGSPNAMPTAIYIAGSAPGSGFNNNTNTFYMQRSESDTRSLFVLDAGAHYTSLIGASGFSSTHVTDHGTGTVILNVPNTDVGLWYSYSDTDAISNIGVAGYPVRLRSGSSIEIRNNSAVEGEVRAGGTFRKMVGIDPNNNLRLDQNNSSGQKNPVTAGYILGDGVGREIRQGLQTQTVVPDTTCDWNLTPNYDSGLWLAHMANVSGNIKETVLVLTARNAGTDPTTATIVSQTGDQAFKVSVVNNTTIRLTSGGSDFYCSVTAVSEGRHMH